MNIVWFWLSEQNRTELILRHCLVKIEITPNQLLVVVHNTWDELKWMCTVMHLFYVVCALASQKQNEHGTYLVPVCTNDNIISRKAGGDPWLKSLPEAVVLLLLLGVREWRGCGLNLITARGWLRPCANQLMRRSCRRYLTAAAAGPHFLPLPPLLVAHAVRLSDSMPPLDRTQLLSKPFKQRKSFGKNSRGGTEGGRGRVGPQVPLDCLTLTVYACCICVLVQPRGSRRWWGSGPSSPTRSRWVKVRYCGKGCGSGGDSLLLHPPPSFSHHFAPSPSPLAGDHWALRAREVPSTAGQDQVPGAARAHHDPVHHHHQVKNPGYGPQVSQVSWPGMMASWNYVVGMWGRQ